MPNGYKNYRPDQRSNDWNTIDIDIPESCENNDLSHQPDSYQRRDDRTN